MSEETINYLVYETLDDAIARADTVSLPGLGWNRGNSWETFRPEKERLVPVIPSES